ncbi:hypothetical protein [Corynebacterium alimapuense]|uniref:Rv2732c family membrane protein n=1 Tax=Corynebacterium alimapuense TaxID=1576874 RepID=UPI0018D51ED5|nr:hypothetical protein [Corynebacterium alimapuense]
MSETTPESDASDSTQIRKNSESVRNLAVEEKKAARRMNLGVHLYTLLAAVVLYVIALLLPQAGDVRGYEILLHLPAASESGIKITEYSYANLLFLGLGLFSTLTLITRRAVFGLIAWMFCTVGLAYSIFAIWLRQTRSSSSDGVDLNIGMWVSILAVALAFFAYSMVALRRDDKQAELADSRAQQENLDEVGYAQRSAMVSQQHASAEDNPLLIDDRRHRAAERHPDHPNATSPTAKPDAEPNQQPTD